MDLDPELRDKSTGELRQFATSLDLSEDQKGKLREFLSSVYEKVREYKQQNPGASREDIIRKIADNRDSLRQRLVSWFRNPWPRCLGVYRKSGAHFALFRWNRDAGVLMGASSAPLPDFLAIRYGFAATKVL